MGGSCDYFVAHSVILLNVLNEIS